MPSSDELLELTLTGPTREAKRKAFAALVASEDWKLVLAPHVVSQQSYRIRDEDFADELTFRMVAPFIAASEDKIQRALELLGSRYAQELLIALAQHMGPDLVEHCLAHLRTADGDRVLLLQEILTHADPTWVSLQRAKRVIRKQLKIPGRHRSQLLMWLANADCLSEFLEELQDYPPAFMEDWQALGKARLYDEKLINLALASVAHDPDPLPYLLQIAPEPEHLLPLLLAAARTDWLVSALEIAIIAGLRSPHIIPLAELGVRMGGRPMSTAVAWLNMMRLGKELLRLLSTKLTRDGRRTRLDDMLWVQRRAPSPNRALEDGRHDRAVDLMDAAIMVRQMRGERAKELVREILGKPRPTMEGNVLKLLCSTISESASEVVALSTSNDPEIARRAKEVLSWPDVFWPEALTE